MLARDPSPDVRDMYKQLRDCHLYYFKYTTRYKLLII
jgi:hypothetical protein